MQTAQQQPREFFNLHTSGIGYLNRIRWVETKGRGRKAESFLACSISALRGSSDAADYTYFDLRVSGEEAIGLIDGLQQEVRDRCKVLVSFKIGDIYPHLYERDVRDQQSGRPTGQKEVATLIKGRLILINSISVDGEKVYSRPSDQDAGHDGEQSQGDDHPMDDDAPDSTQFERSAREEMQEEAPPPRRPVAPQPRTTVTPMPQRRAAAPQPRAEAPAPQRRQPLRSIASGRQPRAEHREPAEA
ncbi:DUF3577 domain-containing protein [Paracidovorax avenae]|uniref:DUF3577 domain-containing protein n=1 Tax=Paracidovorax avenae TaxID=80867 RepID=UPI000D220A16|nr:DUF3577 domain-containing protein [Paracidovorax avenae]AVT09663.1 hypothetical protein C8242_09350 [Paracidovorax avenae]